MRALGLLPLAACVPRAPVEEDPHEAIEAHACEHRSEAGIPVAAAPEDEAPTPLGGSDEPWDVSLPPATAGFGPGLIAVDVDEDTGALLFLGQADLLTGLTHDGFDEDVPSGAPAEGCPDGIPEHVDLDLHAGRWVLRLGPAGIDHVWLLLAEVGGHHDEHEH